MHAFPALAAKKTLRSIKRKMTAGRRSRAGVQPLADAARHRPPLTPRIKPLAYAHRVVFTAIDNTDTNECRK